MKPNVLLLAAALALAAPATLAADYKAGAIEIDHPWSRATPRGAKVATGYFKLTNTGQAPDRLVGVTTAVAAHVDLHEMAVVDGVMRMRPVKDGVAVAPGQTVEFKSGRYHLMMTDLKQPLKQGDRIKATLTFEKAGPVDVEFVIEGMGGPAHPAAGGGAMHMMHDMH